MVVGLKKMHQRRGVQAEAGAHTPSIADGTAKMHLGEEVAATFGDTEDLSPRALCLCRYAPPATYSHALPAFYLSVKKKCLNGEKTASREHSEHLIGGKEKNR